MSVIAATSASAQSTDATLLGQAPLQLFVTLPVKEDRLGQFIAAMNTEVAGAHSEAGNIAFDVYEDGDGSGILYLFEHWVNAAALDDHTQQSYYKAIRGLEAEFLAGTVMERTLSEVPPAIPAGKNSVMATYNLLTLIHTTTSTREELENVFSEVAPYIRAIQGNRGFFLYQDKDRPLEFLLIERWAEQNARDAGIATPAGRHFQASLAGLQSEPIKQTRLINRIQVKD